MTVPFLTSTRTMQSGSSDLCLCTDTRRCQFHAREPRPCVCGGTLEYVSAKHGGVMVPVVSRIPLRGEEPRLVKRAQAFFACNRCERCVKP